MRLVAIDPGPTESALVVWDGQRVLEAFHQPNDFILGRLNDYQPWPLVVEKVSCYGMAVGEDVFETVYWTGRFIQAYGAFRCERMPRMEVKMHLCHTSQAKDPNIRQALIDRFGKPGTKKHPGLLYGIAGDLWAALAVAVTAVDKRATTKSEVSGLYRPPEQVTIPIPDN